MTSSVCSFPGPFCRQLVRPKRDRHLKDSKCSNDCSGKYSIHGEYPPILRETRASSSQSKSCLHSQGGGARWIQYRFAERAVRRNRHDKEQHCWPCFSSPQYACISKKQIRYLHLHAEVKLELTLVQCPRLDLRVQWPTPTPLPLCPQ